ncbi:uncharacterized protein LOC134182963 [Corticium candelabrum]|uniref:uncharacterized protein LOC134182963 n=1 Tax=Corticium candelabrum TaxID=121492 RepID=UPI002E260210|nr:uncharacterized protein LOC134182963 [Corticium candelabrum]
MAEKVSQYSSVTTRQQKLLYVFTYNLVKASDHLQSTRLLRFLQSEGVLNANQAKEVKAQGSPTSRSIVLLESVGANCERDGGVFDKFIEIVDDKQPSVLKDHMPDVKNISDEDLDILYGRVKALGNPFQPERSLGEFGSYNPYVTSRQVPESLKTPDQPVRVEPQYEARVPVAGLKVLWITEMNSQHVAVLNVLKKSCVTFNCDDGLKLATGFSYRACRGEDGGLIHFYIVPGSESEQDIISASERYHSAMNYRPWTNDLDIILLTGHCWISEKQSKGSPKLGDICVVKMAHRMEKGKQDTRKPSAGPFTLVDHVCKNMQSTKPGRWQTSDAVRKRPEVSYYWQASWLTRLHYEICRQGDGKKPSQWLIKTGYDERHPISDRNEDNEEKLAKILPNWDDDDMTVLKYCRESKLWEPDAKKPGEAFLEQVKTEVRMSKKFPVEDVEVTPRVHVAPVLSGFETSVKAEEMKESGSVADWTSVHFYKHANTLLTDKTVVSIKAVVGYTGLPGEPQLESYGDELVAIFTLDLIKGLHQNPRFK